MSTVSPVACHLSQGTKWCDTTADVDTRAAAFVKALKLEEKAGIMVNNGKGVERLHLPPYQVPPLASASAFF